jgi:uroporphyrinogen III methyltransferase/synthase
MKKPKVYLVGAGPGRAELITVRGAELLKSADCIIYDKLANTALLRFARADAEIIHVPKRTAGRSFVQDEINEILIKKAAAGLNVVRLKGGDPGIFGRASEELNALVEAGFDFEIVPGVTAASGASAYTGIMITDKQFSSQVIFVTGHEAPDKEQSGVDLAWLAKSPGTIVFYMGMGNLKIITDGLMGNAMPAETPTAIIANATLPGQRTVRATLATIVETCAEQKVQPPAIVVIGAAAASDKRFDWLCRKPLFGKIIVVTRDVVGNSDFAARIIERGGCPVSLPMLKITPLTHKSTFLQTLAKIGEYRWVVFTSRNGVRVFFDALAQLNRDCRVFASSKIAAIGPGTAAELSQHGICPDFVPDVFTGAELAKQLIVADNVNGKNMLLLRSEIASKDLLTEAGASVDDVAIYTAQAVKNDTEQLADDLAAGRIDYITFASPSAAESFFSQVQVDTVNSSSTRIVSIGPVTSEKLGLLNCRIDLQAAEHTIEGLIEAMENADT